MNKNKILLASAVSAMLIIGLTTVFAQQPVNSGQMEHSSMDHSGNGSAATQSADPGKAKPNNVVDGMDMRGGDKGMGGMDHGAGHGGGMMRKMMCGFADQIDGRLAFLKAELKLTEQQNTVWNTFSESWRGVATKALAKCDAMGAHMNMQHEDGGVIGKLSMMEMHMADHLEVVRAQKAALEPLFNVLDDKQKKTANEIFSETMKVGMQMGGHMKHGSGMKH